MGFIIAKDYVTAVNVEIVPLLAARLVNLGNAFRLNKTWTVMTDNYFLALATVYSLPDFHPCTRACHAPSTCPETEPCESLITLTCPCGRIRQPVLCAQTTSHHSGHSNAAPKCSNECQIAKRNARLADAFGINQESNDNKSTGVVTYSDELTGYARVNMKFLALVEKTFQE